jgi:hypothetical protein
MIDTITEFENIDRITAQAELSSAAKMVFPILKYIHTNQQIITAVLPDDDLVFPRASVMIQPFYMNRTDPTETGVWQISTRGSDKGLAVRLNSVSTANGPILTLTSKGPDGRQRSATDQENFETAYLLRLLKGDDDLETQYDYFARNNDKVSRGIGKIIGRIAKRKSTKAA